MALKRVHTFWTIEGRGGGGSPRPRPNTGHAPPPPPPWLRTWFNVPFPIANLQINFFLYYLPPVVKLPPSFLCFLLAYIHPPFTPSSRHLFTLNVCIVIRLLPFFTCEEHILPLKTGVARPNRMATQTYKHYTESDKTLSNKISVVQNFSPDRNFVT